MKTNKNNVHKKNTSGIRNTGSKCVSVGVCPHLPLLADDGDSILQFDIMEKTLQKNVGHSYKVVVLLRLIERITMLTVCLVILGEKHKKTQ